MLEGIEQMKFGVCEFYELVRVVCGRVDGL